MTDLIRATKRLDRLYSRKWDIDRAIIDSGEVISEALIIELADLERAMAILLDFVARYVKWEMALYPEPKPRLEDHWQ